MLTIVDDTKRAMTKTSAAQPKRVRKISFLDVGLLGNPEVGSRIRAYRNLAGLSQVELGVKAGLSQTEISRLERTPQDCRLRSFQSVCAALSSVLGDLLGSDLSLADLVESEMRQVTIRQ